MFNFPYNMFELFMYSANSGIHHEKWGDKSLH